MRQEIAEELRRMARVAGKEAQIEEFIGKVDRANNLAEDMITREGEQVEGEVKDEDEIALEGETEERESEVEVGEELAEVLVDESAIGAIVEATMPRLLEYIMPKLQDLEARLLSAIERQAGFNEQQRESLDVTQDAVANLASFIDTSHTGLEVRVQQLERGDEAREREIVDDMAASIAPVARNAARLRFRPSVARAGEQAQNATTPNLEDIANQTMQAIRAAKGL